MSGRLWIGIGAGFGFLAVALGAMGAHGLESRLDARAMGHWETAAHYQALHALALLATGVWAASLSAPPRSYLNWAGGFFAAGILLFSGSLYALALTGTRAWGMITPFGGVAFLAGWLVLVRAAGTRLPG